MDIKPVKTRPKPPTTPKEPPESHKVLKRVLIVVISILAIAGIVFTIYFLRGDAQTSQAVEISDQFLAHVSANEAIEAYELTSFGFQSNTGYVQFEQAVSQISAILMGAFRLIDQVDGDDQFETTSLRYESLGSDQVLYIIIVDMLNEVRTWQVSNLSIEPANSQAPPP